MDHCVAPPPASDSSAGILAQPPVQVIRPDRPECPLVFVSAHSGRAYPADFVAAARLDERALRRSEDGFVDELFAAVPRRGAPLLLANFPRAYCDANREAWELDPAMFIEPLPPWVNTTSPRVGVGLGTIARVVASGQAIYRDKLPFAQAENRVKTCWQPFHQQLAALIAETRDRFGICLLIDCHSMPALSVGSGDGGARARIDMVLGDAFGTACAPRLILAIERCLAGFGYAVRRNDPYAGGYITRHYGRPREGVHAVQIEIARPLYLDEARMLPGAGFDRVRSHMDVLVAMLVAQGQQLVA
jgi:N-formylglutamate deformylase